MIIKIATIAICAGLWLWGGLSFKQARVSILPFILGVVCAWLSQTWWIFFAVFAGLQTARLGYGEDSPLYRFLGAWLARGVYCLIVAGSCAVGVVIAQKVLILMLIPYLVLNFAAGALLCKKEAPIWIIDPIIGACIASIVLLLI